MDLATGRRVRQLFRDRFGGGGPPERLFFASGRVNLLGAHVDYHGGPVLPVAVDRGVFVAARVRADRRLRAVSLDFPGSHDLDLDAPPKAADAGFAAYPLGICVALEEGGARLRGLDLAFGGTVPAGAGMSSSAAILVATATAVAETQGIALPPLERGRLAFRAETRFVGVKCGIMDQFASALGRAGHALWLDCKDQSFDYVPLPVDRMSFMMLDSMTRRELASGSYNRRVDESMGALAKIRRTAPAATCLRDVTSGQLERARGDLSDVEWKRARHVVGEVARVQRARALLVAGDLLEFGALMWQSHQSSRHLYEVSTERLDALHELSIGHPDCYGARLTGAGFGGCALAVVRRGCEEPFRDHVVAGFARRFGTPPEVHPVGFGGAPLEVGDA
jgi:galactokinase